MEKILIINDFYDADEIAEQTALGGFKKQVITNILNRFKHIEVEYYCIHRHQASSEINPKDFINLKQKLIETNANVICPLGNYALSVVTGLSGINKWHMSIIKTKSDYGAKKVIPLLHPKEVFYFPLSRFYIQKGIQRAVEESVTPEITQHDRKFHIGLSLNDTITFLEEKALKADAISVDVETCNGIINTVGIAISPYEAIAIKTLTSDYTPEDFHLLWKTIGRVLESPNKKIFQNFMYDCQFISAYGICVQNIYHDTMICMKFLNPELEMGLDNVGRLYTTFPFWKDDGKDWANVKNWDLHLEYNCKDTTGTYMAYLNQAKELEQRKLDKLFYSFVMKFADPAREMCTRGLLVDEEKLGTIKTNVQNDIDRMLTDIRDLTVRRAAMELNPRSPKQMKEVLFKLGYAIPTKKGAETTDKKALIKMAKRYPNEALFPLLIRYSAQNKLMSSYINFDYDKDKKCRYYFGICNTETGRWNSRNDPWGRGFNVQTIPKQMRKIFIAETEKVLMQIDLKQAESRYVAWDSAEERLMELLIKGEDIHKYVASKIFNKPEDQVTNEERQLGKKSGHAANYGVGAKTFAEACLVEMGMSMSDREADRIINGYFNVFPQIKKRQYNIRQTVNNCRKLTTPIGRERYFYGRLDDSTYREAYAYAPQSTIPDITNFLMLHLYGKVELLAQIHDALLLQVDKSLVLDVAHMANNLKDWHPKINLPGGELWIPVDIEVGNSWGTLEKL